MADENSQADVTTTADETNGETPKETLLADGADTTPPKDDKEGEKPSLVDAEKEGEKPPVVPEKYDLKPPENSHLKEGDLEKIAAYAREQGFSQEQAQKYLERETQVVSDFVKNQEQQLATNDQAWKQQLVEDKEFGGDSLKENGILAYEAAKNWGGEELVTAIRAGKLNHFPPLFKMLVRIAKATADDKLIHPSSKASPPRERSAADVIWGTKET
jgi:hypothetical protein